MSKEKKLKRYAENRLSSFADGEDSLARLKKEQALNAPRKEKKERSPFLFKKAAVTFSAVVVIAAVAVCFARFAPIMTPNKATPTASNSSASEPKGSSWHWGADDASGNHGFLPSPKGGSQTENAGESSSPSNAEILAELNAATEFLKLTLPSGASARKSDSVDGYEITLYDGGKYLFGALVSFEKADPEDAAFGNRRATIGEQPFVYKEDRAGVWQGIITTEKEIVYVVYCVSEGEENFLRTVGSYFSKK